MKKPLRRILSLALALLMCVSVIPLTAPEAKAYGVSGYNGIVAAQWAKDHLNDSWSLLQGRGYYDDGGDCANFVSQCIYMGGMNMNTAWNYNGYPGHYSAESDGSWIQAHQLYEYVVSQGGESINAPSASQVSIGDLIFWKTASDGKMHHSAIVIDIVNGVPVIAYHSTRDASGKEINRDTYSSGNWTLGYDSWRIYLVKMHGETCTSTNPRDFDVYCAYTASPFRQDAATTAKYIATVAKGEYIHVYHTRYNQGITWGYCNYMGVWGWTNLSNFYWNSHATSAAPSHLFGDWFTDTNPTCISEGRSKHVCVRCGYAETKAIAPTGHTPGAAPTCTEPQVCVVCNTLLQDPLGHEFVEELVEPTCLTRAQLSGHCTRCDLAYSYDAATSSWSDWSPVSHDTADPDDERVRTAYRWRQRDVKTSYNASEGDWVRINKEWEYVSSGSKEYSTFTSGNGGSYSEYVKNLIRGNGHDYDTAPYYADQTETYKMEVSNSFVCYLYWHECRGKRLNSSLNNGLIGGEWNADPEFSHFHYYCSFYDFSYHSDKNAFECYNEDACSVTKWYHRVNIYRSDYTDYRAKFTYEKYSNWSDWTTASEFPETIQNMIRNGQTQLTVGNTTYYVEQRQEYQYSLSGALGHDWHTEDDYLADAETGEKIWKVTKQPTAEEEGEAVCICNRDAGHTATIVLPKEGCSHVWSDWSEIPCPEGGTVTRTCSLCGSTESKYIEPGHVWGAWETVTAAVAHVSDGLERRICQRDPSHVQERVIDAHTLDYVKTEPRTCTEDGYDLYRCTVCGEKVKKNIDPASGHDMSGGYHLRTPSVCNRDGSITPGEEVNICLRCGYEETRPVYTEHDIQPVTVVTVIQPGDERYDTICEIHDIAYTCTKCGYIKSTETDEIRHDWETDESGELVWTTLDEASHGHNGLEVNVCLNHSEHRRTQTIPMPDDHDWERGIVVDVPCSYNSETGVERKGYSYKQDQCTVCGELSLPYDQEITDHQFGEWHVTKASTCTEEGKQQRECTVCGYPEIEILDPNGHQWGSPYVDTESTCYDAGSEVHQCQVCGLIEPVGDIGALGHLWGDGIDENDSSTWTVVKEATCEEDGLKRIVCLRDASHFKEEKIPAKGHQYEGTGEGAATCTEPAYKEYTCTECGKTYKQYVGQPTGHDYCIYHDDGDSDTHQILCANDPSHIIREEHRWDDGKKTADPKCEDPGTFTYTCLDCGATKTEDIPAINHNYGDWVDDENGLTHTKTCANDASHTVTEKHVYGEWIVDKTPTCTETGARHHICTVCEYVQNDTIAIDPDAHDWGDWFVETAPTCSAVGVEKRICKRNPAHAQTRDIEIDPDAHKAESFYTVDVKADCENDGSKSHHCEYCDAILDSAVIPARGHDLTSVTTSSNCSEAGEIVYTCSHTDATDEYKACHYTYTEPIAIDPDAHDWGDWFVETAPTCSAVGVEKRICKRNPAHAQTRDIEIDPDAHKAESFYTVDVKADCENDGSKSHHCEYCDAILDSVVIPARDHDLTSVTTSSNCSEAGEIVYTCSHTDSTDEYEACSYTYTEPIEIDPDAHDWGRWFVTTAPTCSTVGVEKRICKRDPSHVETRDIAIDPNAHTDADADGYCDDCNTELTQQSDELQFRCKMCPTYERLRDVPYVGVIVSIVHLFVHMAHFIGYVT